MQCCDPYLVTYVSAIITMVEAALFACLNLVLVLINRCAIPPPTGGHKIVEDFLEPIWKKYLLENGTCKDDLAPDDWEWPNSTTIDAALTPQKNFEYQLTYLVLHFIWIICCIVLIFGNARKRWGYYIPWLLMSLTIIIMDTVIGSMYLSNLNGIPASHIFNADFWMGMLYMRFEAIWFMNIIQLFNVLHAFCICYRKRAKQARRDKKIEAKVRAEVTAEQNSSQQEQQHENPQQQQQPPQQQQLQQHQQQVMKISDAADLGVISRSPPAPRNLRDERNQQDMECVPRAPPPRYAQPPVPDVVYRNPSTAPQESRPYSYLNPGFRPSGSHDVDGMKKHGVPSHPGFVNEGYVKDEDRRMHRPMSRRRSLDDFQEDGELSDSPLNRGHRQYRPPQGSGPAGVRRNQSYRPPGSHQSDGETRRPTRYSQQRRPTNAPAAADYDVPWDANARSSGIRKMTPALPRVYPAGPPPPSKGPDPRYRESVHSRPSRQHYEY